MLFHFHSCLCQNRVRLMTWFLASSPHFVLALPLFSAFRLSCHGGEGAFCPPPHNLCSQSGRTQHSEVVESGVDSPTFP